MRYQQINSFGVCQGYSDGPDPINAPHMIPSGDADDFVGWRWDGTEWIDPPASPAEDIGAAINDERDRRINAGFMFLGYLFQNRPEDRENIAGAKSAATDAITMFHAEPGDLRWQRLIDASAPDEDFRFITADNTHVPLDAYQTMQLGYTALLNKQRLIFAGNALKAMDPIPADFTDDRWWQ